jgi:cell division protease FtsH
VHTRKIPLADDVNLSILARGTPGFSGADLANMVNEAALNAARHNRKTVLMYDFELAKDKVLMGAERRSMILTDEEKKVTAYHEAGHALVAALSPNSDPLHKVTIIPRADAWRRRCSSTRCPPAPATTLSAPPIWPAKWSASGA